MSIRIKIQALINLDPKLQVLSCVLQVVHKEQPIQQLSPNVGGAWDTTMFTVMYLHL